MMRDVIAGMATHPPRFSFCLEAVRSIAPQVDRLYLYVNQELEYAPFDESDTPENVKIIWSGIAQGDLKDAGKFYAAQGREDCYYLSCDDDLIYPPEYAAKLVQALEEGLSACGFHGCLVPGYVGSSYYDNRKYVSHYRSDVRSRKHVNVLGTGVAGYDLSMVDVDLSAFGDEPIADLYMAQVLQDQQIPATVLPHPSGWIQKNPETEKVPEVHENDRLDEKQAGFINEREWVVYRD